MGRLTLGILILFLSACATMNHPVKLVDMNKGQIIRGEYNKFNHQVTVFMPDGEVLTGTYSLNYESATAFGNSSGSATVVGGLQTLTGYSSTISSAQVHSNSGRAYGILTGNKGTVMEILVNYTGSSGFGTAVTNKGKRYGVQF